MKIGVVIRTTQNIRYRATATLRRLQIKQYVASNEGGGQNQREHPKILIKYIAVHPMAVSEYYEIQITCVAAGAGVSCRTCAREVVGAFYTHFSVLTAMDPTVVYIYK